MSEKLDSFLKKHLDAYIAETARLCAQPSISAKGEGTHACATLIVDTLEKHGYRVHKFATPGNPIIVGHADGTSRRTLLFYNHYDVQPAEPLELWTTPPFEPTIRDGALYARGSKDDKGEFMARVMAVDAVRALHDGKLPCGVTFVVEGEEEIGSPHIAQFVREHTDLLQSHGAIWEEGGIDPEGRPEIGLGRRGVLSVELSVEAMTRDAHSGSAHVLPNAAWRLTWALAALKHRDERIRIPGFYDHVKPPSEADLKLLDELPDFEAWRVKTFGVKDFVRGLRGKQLNRAVFEPTCNIQGINAGYQGAGNKTVIPARASAKIDFRLVPDQSPDDIFAKLREHLDKQGFEDVRVEWSGAMWPCKVSVDDPFVRLTARVGQEIYGHPTLLSPMGGGSSPMYAFAKPLDIPIVTCGVGYANNRTHAPDEHVRLVDFLNAARHIGRILDAFADLGDKPQAKDETNGD